MTAAARRADAAAAAPDSRLGSRCDLLSRERARTVRREQRGGGRRRERRRRRGGAAVGVGRDGIQVVAVRLASAQVPRQGRTARVGSPRRPPPRRAATGARDHCGPAPRAHACVLGCARHRHSHAARAARAHQREARARHTTRAPREATRLARRTAGAGDAQSVRRSALEAHAPRGRRRHVAGGGGGVARGETRVRARRRPRGGAAPAPSDRRVGHSRCEEAKGARSLLAAVAGAAAAAGRAATAGRPAAARPAVG